MRTIMVRAVGTCAAFGAAAYRYLDGDTLAVGLLMLLGVWAGLWTFDAVWTWHTDREGRAA